MARDIQDVQNVDAASPDYPNGKMRDKAGATSGTILGEPLFGDMVQFFSKLMRDAQPSVTPNGNPDNVTNTFQLFEAFINYVRNVLVATDTAKGTVEKATPTERDAGTSDKFIDAELLNSMTSTTARLGIIEKATESEVQNREVDKNITSDNLRTDTSEASSFTNGYVQGTTYGKLKYRRINGTNSVHVFGSVGGTSGTNQAVFFTLPSGYRPIGTIVKYFSVFGNDSSLYTMEIATNGEMRFRDNTSGVFAILIDIIFNIEDES